LCTSRLLWLLVLLHSRVDALQVMALPISLYTTASRFDEQSKLL